jgi:hypothetical protein
MAGNDWLPLSQVSEGAHFRKTAVTSKKLSVAQQLWTAEGDPADLSMVAAYSFSA